MMKVIVLFKLLSLIIILNITSFNKSEAFFFKEPVEECMDIFIDDDYSTSSAARRCRGVDKGIVTCMKKLIRDDYSPGTALRRCKPSSW